MIDLHAHILPGLDDGAQTIEDSIGLAELALEGGTEIIVATPHSNQKGRFENYYTEELKKAYRDLKQALEQENLPLKILPGMEIFASGDIREKIRDGALIGLNHTDYYLVEFAFDENPYWMGSCLEDMLDLGKIPLVAHPERYFCIQEHPETVYEWLQMGCRIQINKGSLFGKFGRHAKKLADRLLEWDMVTCVASDAHSPFMRTTFLGDAADYLAEQYGEERMHRLLEENPRTIIQNGRIPAHGYMPEKRHWFFR